MSPSSIVLPFSVEELHGICRGTNYILQTFKEGEDFIIFHSKNNNTTNPLVIFYD